MKRHRNLRFAAGADDCPASIVITTLSARVYNHEADTFTALLNIARAMPRHIENRNGVWWVANPVHPEENFADKDDRCYVGTDRAAEKYGPPR